MEETNIVEGNKLIAEFMGIRDKVDCWNANEKKFVPSYHIEGRTMFMIARDLKYHTSWDWLKPVVDEIFTYSVAFPEQAKPIRAMSIVVDITACYNRVLQFIKWHNESEAIKHNEKSEK
jgi:hypothetical protein